MGGWGVGWDAEGGCALKSKAFYPLSPRSVAPPLLHSPPISTGDDARVGIFMMMIMMMLSKMSEC